MLKKDTKIRRWILGLAPIVLGVAVAALLALRPPALRTSLADLVGDGANAIPASVRNASADLVPVLASDGLAPAAQDRGLASAALRELRAALPTDVFQPDTTNFLAAFESDFRGLASLDDVRRLATSEGRAKIARSALRRFVTSPIPPFFPPADDPFALADGFVRGLMKGHENWTFREGFIVAKDAQGNDVFISLLHLRPAVTRNTDALIGFYEKLGAAMDDVRAAHPSVRIEACGVPLHTAITTAKCRTEINWLSAFSVVFIVLLAIFAFRGIRWIPLLVASLLVSTLAGAAALFLFFDEIHVMTIVFGTTVLGLVIDYSFHWLLAASRDGLVRNLTISCLTTEISLLPLMLSSLPVLRQSATFLAVALAAALAYVVFGYPGEESGMGNPTPSVGCRLSSVVLIRVFDHSTIRLSLIALLLLGLIQTRFGTSLAALYRPPAELAAAERTFAELSGSSDQDRGFLVFDRETIAADIAKLYDEQGAKQGAALGLDQAPRPPKNTKNTEAALTSVPRPKGELPSSVRFIQPRLVLEATLARWTHETCRRLAFALAFMFVALVVFFRRRAFKMFLPSLVAIASVAALLGFFGEKVNLFHLLACFLLAGMSIDYTVFLHNGGRAAFKPALCSLLTSLVGFGALSFVSFPVVQSFGIVLGIGLPIGFVLALVSKTSQKP